MDPDVISPPRPSAPARREAPVGQEVDRYAGVRQYSLRHLVALWAAATVPMSLMAWLVAPWLADRIGGREPLVGALLICFNVGLIWIVVLTLIMIRREQGLEAPAVKRVERLQCLV